VVQSRHSRADAGAAGTVLVLPVVLVTNFFSHKSHNVVNVLNVVLVAIQIYYSTGTYRPVHGVFHFFHQYVSLSQSHCHMVSQSH
jgi:hypothetical protein